MVHCISSIVLRRGGPQRPPFPEAPAYWQAPNRAWYGAGRLYERGDYDY